MLFVVALLCVLIVPSALGIHDTLNFILPPGERSCFYEDFDKITPARRIEAFVQSGGNLDVVLTIHGPLDLEEVRKDEFEKVIIEEKIDSSKESLSEEQSFSMDFKPKLPGTYGFCLDNRKSRFAKKVIQLDIRHITNSAPEIIKVEEKIKIEPGDEALIKVQETLSNIRKGVNKILLQQQRDRYRLSLHSETNKISHRHVVFDSMVETAVFIVVALFQVFFVQRWFVSRQNAAGKQRA